MRSNVIAGMMALAAFGGGGYSPPPILRRTRAVLPSRGEKYPGQRTAYLKGAYVDRSVTLPHIPEKNPPGPKPNPRKSNPNRNKRAGLRRIK